MFNASKRGDDLVKILESIKKDKANRESAKKLLKDFFLFIREHGVEYIGMSIEELLNEYLKR